MLGMQFLLIILSMTAFGLLNTAYAQPLEDVNTTILEFEDFTASVQLTWNFDDSVSNYEIGCVSCIPNFSESTTNSEIILQNITSLENGLALLYIIAYGDNDEIITAKQVTLELR